jgi:FkbM family methyltransferase
MLRYILRSFRSFIGLNPAPCEYRLELDGFQFAVEATRGDLAPYAGIFIDHEYALDQRFVPEPGSTVLDVGAQVGFFCAYASALVGSGRIFAFEPDPASFDRLQKNISANRLDNIHLQRMAVSDTAGVVLFDCFPLSVDSRITTKRSARTVEVPSTTLDDFVRSMAIERIDLLKIDTEGFEAHVLRGARAEALPRVRRIIVEIHTPRLREEVEAILQPAGFKRTAETNGVYFFMRDPTDAGSSAPP